MSATQPEDPPFDYDAARKYLNTLKEGERVIETSRSAFWNRHGTVYIKSEPEGGVCVLWDPDEGETARMGTSVTWGTRRLSDHLADTYKLLLAKVDALLNVDHDFPANWCNGFDRAYNELELVAEAAKAAKL